VGLMQWTFALTLGSAALGTVIAQVRTPSTAAAGEVMPSTPPSSNPGGDPGLGVDDGLADDEALGQSSAKGDAPTSLLEAFFYDLNASTLEPKVLGTYAFNVVYEDPTGHFENRDNLLSHLKTLISGVTALNVNLKEEFVSGDETVALWTMTLASNRLHGGEPFVIEGSSHIRIKDGKVVYQRDYYDLGGAVYEQVPVLSMFVRWVKGKLVE